MLKNNLINFMEKQLPGQTRNEGEYGPGTWTDSSFTPVPKECKRLLAVLARETPGFTKDHRLLDNVTFEGDDLPNIPGPLKSQVLTSVMHAMVGIVGQEILKIKGTPTDGKINIKSNMGGLYSASPALMWIDGVEGPAVLALPTVPHLRPPPSMGIDMDYDHYMVGNKLKLRSQAIYPTATKDAWFQLHGSTDPYAALRAIGISQELVDGNEANAMTGDEAYNYIKERTLKYQAKELELIMIEQSQYNFIILCKYLPRGHCANSTDVPSSIVYSPAAWSETIMGKSLAKHPLINYKKLPQAAATPPTLFPEVLDKRPLAGIRVVELARIIALPATGAILTSMGAEVIRVQSKHLPDFSVSELTSTIFISPSAFRYD